MRLEDELERAGNQREEAEEERRGKRADGAVL